MAMNFVEWLFLKTPTIEDLPPQQDAPGSRPDASPPITDPPEITAPQGAETGDYLENLFCHLEYEDAAGHLTRRPVTFLSLSREKSPPSVIAVCHLRRALRKFRVDRIRSIITADGEYFDGRAFLTEVLGLDLGIVAPLQQKRLQRDIPNAILSPLTVLAACGNADGWLHGEEVDRIMSWAEREVMILNRNGQLGTDLTLEEADALGMTIRTMRPQRHALRRHMLATLKLPDMALERFRRTLQLVIEADGKIHDRETEFLEEFDSLTADPPSLDAQLSALAFELN